MKNKRIGIIGHIDHSKTSLASSIIHGLGQHELKTINEIIEEEKSIKITNRYNDLEPYIGASMLYNSVSNKLSKYGKKRGSNFTPKKKKRK
jgi:translation initiation factor 2 gamma subunit (eIF-2gamma)